MRMYGDASLNLAQHVNPADVWADAVIFLDGRLMPDASVVAFDTCEGWISVYAVSFSGFSYNNTTLLHGVVEWYRRDSLDQ